MGRWLPVYLSVWFVALLVSRLTDLGPQATPTGDGQQQVATSEKPAAGRERFGLTEVWKVQLDLGAAEYDAMQPAVPAFGFPGAPPVAPAKKGNDKRTSERNLFGTEFFWAQASLTVGEKTLDRVGMRYSGDMAYFVSAQGAKRPLKLEINKFQDQSFAGLTAVNLQSMPLDPAKAREVLALAIFRDAGVVAPQSAFADVTLSVPGKFNKESIGLYAVIQNVDQRFFAERLKSDQGLIMKPFRIRGIDYLGDGWEQYVGQYNPQRLATPEEAKRVIAFARLVNQSTDEEFQKQIESYLDVDQFLRFMAANALVSNLNSFFALGHNYYLYLDSKTGRFVFVPGDLESSFANFLLLGTGNQLLDLSLKKPYPGENKLPDRLLSIQGFNEKYLQILNDLSRTAFTKERLLKDIDAIERATQDIRVREAAALAARKEVVAPLGPPGGMGPQGPDLRTFAEQRTGSVKSQLAGMAKGYIPQPFNFGPAPRPAADAQPIDEKTFRDVVRPPAGFDATLFAAPPQVNSPVAIAAAPSREIYVAVDEQGSLGRATGGGRIVRCRDRDDDGKVDDVTVFAKVEHPRGLVYRAGSVWVMHPPTLSVFHDDNGDGVADRENVLVTGLTTEQITNRGGDHTTNGIRMGIDGWLYIGVGDYGVKEARGKDGNRIVMRGGGIVRVRPDGTELEIFCTGLRNPFDIAIDPQLNLFTRDNTNDGAGWDTRVSHLMQTASYGYTQLFTHFTDETMPTLGTFGGGGGTGALFVSDSRWPEKYRHTLFTGDWGRSEIYHHELKVHGPTFDLKQEVFFQMPRATGMDVDADGRLYAASWRGGEASIFVGKNVGFIARISPAGISSNPFPDLKPLDPESLVRMLGTAQPVARNHIQWEILTRGRNARITTALVALCSDSASAVEGRAAAIFTLKQLDGSESHPALINFTRDADTRRFALRALADRKTEISGLDPSLFVAALSDASALVQSQALIALGRLNDVSAAKAIIPLTERPAGSIFPTQRPVQNQPDADRFISHLALRALVLLNSVDECLAAVDGPHWKGALQALRVMHSAKSVEGLIKKLGSARSPDIRRAILVALIRLYHREADYDGSWWGIRPDTAGPYYDRVTWDISPRIGSVITAAILDSDASEATYLRRELQRHQVALPGLPVDGDAVKTETEMPLALPKADPNSPDQIGNLPLDTVLRQAVSVRGDAKRGEALFKAQSCTSCHTTIDGQTPKGPHLVDIGKRYRPEELVESILKPSAKLAQGYESYAFELSNGRVLIGFVVSERADATVVREATGVRRELKRSEVEARVQQKLSAMPEGLAANLRADQLADLLAYLQSLK